MRLLTRAFFLGGRACHLASTIFHSAAAASLTLAELRAGIPEHWQDFNSREADVDAGLVDWERAFADEWVHPGSAALVAGCGSGREMLALLARGCRVTGVDPAARALDRARRLLSARGLSARLVEGFLDDTAVDGTFNVVWFGNATYNLIPERARRVGLLRRLSAQLNPGGVIYIDYQALPPPRRLVARVARIAGAIARSDWRLEPGDLVGWRQRGGQVFYSYGHAFVPEEIESESRDAGLRVVSRLGTDEYPVFVLQRPT